MGGKCLELHSYRQGSLISHYCEQKLSFSNYLKIMDAKKHSSGSSNPFLLNFMWKIELVSIELYHLLRVHAHVNNISAIQMFAEILKLSTTNW